MYKIIDLNSPEKTVFKIKLFKLLDKVSLSNNFIITFILDYDLKQLQLVKESIKEFNDLTKNKYKILKFSIIDDSRSNECDGRERLALVLSDISSLKNSINLIDSLSQLKEIYKIYNLKQKSKIRIEKW